MNLDHYRQLFGYTFWANKLLLDSCSALSVEQQHTPVLAGLPPVFNILVHIFGAQELWLNRLNGISPAAMPTPADFPDLQKLAHDWKALNLHTMAFLAGLGEGGLELQVTYQTTKGKSFTTAPWQALSQVINHATQHRAEIAAILTALERSPGDLDFTFYLRNIA
jgi:uncharacterized damage-inducible protein DinB